MTNDTEARKAAARMGLWTVIDLLGVRAVVPSPADLVDEVLSIEDANLSLPEVLVLGVFLTNAAEQQMTAAADLAQAEAAPDPEPEVDPNLHAEGFAPLVGKTVDALYLGGEDWSENTKLYIAGEAGVLELTTHGDCCSHTWWQDIMQVKQLIGARVVRAERIEMPDVPEDQQQEVDVDYGVRVHTDRGACTLVYRNTSNGYYGGWYTPAMVDAVPTEAKPVLEDLG